MGIRVGASWRTGPGRRAWVSVPGWLLLPWLLVELVIVAVMAVWYLLAAVVQVIVITVRWFAAKAAENKPRRAA